MTARADLEDCLEDLWGDSAYKSYIPNLMTTFDVRYHLELVGRVELVTHFDDLRGYRRGQKRNNAEWLFAKDRVAEALVMTIQSPSRLVSDATRQSARQRLVELVTGT